MPLHDSCVNYRDTKIAEKTGEFWRTRWKISCFLFSKGTKKMSHYYRSEHRDSHWEQKCLDWKWCSQYSSFVVSIYHRVQKCAQRVCPKWRGAQMLFSLLWKIAILFVWQHFVWSNAIKAISKQTNRNVSAKMNKQNQNNPIGNVGFWFKVLLY